MGLRNMGWAAVLLVALAAGLPGTTNASSDDAPAASAGFEQAAREHLPGTWQFHYVSEKPPMTIDGTSTYFADGTAKYEAEFRIGEQSLPVTMEATWEVRGDKMITVITRSSLPEAAPVGSVSTDTIHELSASVFRYTDDEEGMTITETRQAQ